MQVEILFIPPTAKFLDWLAICQVYPLTRASVSEHSDNHWFGKEGNEICLDDLIIKGIEFKVIHEKA